MEGTILVVDDERNIRRTLRMVLEGDGLEVRDAERAEDALSILAEESVDVLVTDIRLPGMSGIELLERVKRDPATAAMPVVVISATADQGRRVLNGDAVGVVDWLDKPIDPARLRQALRGS
jgi:CheY-like chemotaxis protein